MAGGGRIKLREKERARKVGGERVDGKGERSRLRETDIYIEREKGRGERGV